MKLLQKETDPTGEPRTRRPSVISAGEPSLWREYLEMAVDREVPMSRMCAYPLFMSVVDVEVFEVEVMIRVFSVLRTAPSGLPYFSKRSRKSWTSRVGTSALTSST